MSFLGIDIGTSGCKSVAFDERGKIIVSHYREYDTFRDATGRSEIDARDVWDKIAETIRVCAVLLTPFMPESMAKALDQIGADVDRRTWESLGEWGDLPAGVTVHRGENLFPRIDAEKELAELEALHAAENKSPIELEPYATESVDFDTFCKSDFRAVKVKACDAVKKSEKLLRFTLDDGSGTDRQILSGIHKFYEPEQLVGKTLLAIINLPPRKMMGLESCGMLISAVHKENGEEKLNLVMLDDAIPAGAKMC